MVWEGEVKESRHLSQDNPTSDIVHSSFLPNPQYHQQKVQDVEQEVESALKRSAKINVQSVKTEDIIAPCLD
jgi:hypothetical protein